MFRAEQEKQYYDTPIKFQLMYRDFIWEVYGSMRSRVEKI